MTTTFTLGDILDDSAAKQYFEEIFVRLVPWLTTNHFTVRLYSYCAWLRNIESCQRRNLNAALLEDKYISTLLTFMKKYADSQKLYDKIKDNFYLMRFDPLQDFNIEFIFRELMTLFDVIDNEKISSRAFLKVNPQPVAFCPFNNPARRDVYTSADPMEAMAQEAETQPSVPSEDITSNESFQKKILPWEMMLQTDVDLTKSLVQKKRRRNDLIVVASLIDRLPNLAGLCRTCEIFNASQLVVYSLKVTKHRTKMLASRTV